MNNQAFRELVNKQRGSAKTSKQIAKQAVEEEFQELKRKRKLKGGDGGFDGDFNMSDDENDGDDDDNNKNKNGKGDDKAEDDEGKTHPNKKGRWKKQRKKNENGEDSSKNMYRDRAKERREGKNVDYQGTENISLPNGVIDPNAGEDGGGAFGNTTNAQYKNDMTKFLGGDEEFTHLVKGLDKSLADKVRREEMLERTKGDDDDEQQGDEYESTKLLNDEDIDLDEVMEEAKSAQSKMKKKNDRVTKAETIIGEKKSSSSSLVSSMALYIQKVEEHEHDRKLSSSSTGVQFSKSGNGRTSSTAAKTIHRSKLTFSLQENHHNLQLYGWEIPKVSVISNSQYAAMVGDSNNINDDFISRASLCTPLDNNLILRIQSVLDSVNMKSQEQTKKRQNSRSYISSSNSNKKKKKSKTEKQKNDGGPATSIINNQLKTQVEDDSDDDIYDDIGDYVPPTVK